MLVPLGGGAGRGYTLVPVSFLSLLDFNFLMQKVSTIKIEKAFARFDRRVGSNGWRGQCCYMNSPQRPLRPVSLSGKTPISLPSPVVLEYGSSSLTGYSGPRFGTVYYRHRPRKVLNNEEGGANFSLVVS